MNKKLSLVLLKPYSISCKLKDQACHNNTKWYMRKTETIREVFEGSKRIIYRSTSKEKVEVVAILHTARFFDKDNIL